MTTAFAEVFPLMSQSAALQPRLSGAVTPANAPSDVFATLLGLTLTPWGTAPVVTSPALADGTLLQVPDQDHHTGSNDHPASGEVFPFADTDLPADSPPLIADPLTLVLLELMPQAEGQTAEAAIPDPASALGNMPPLTRMIVQRPQPGAVWVPPSQAGSSPGPESVMTEGAMPAAARPEMGSTALPTSADVFPLESGEEIEAGARMNASPRFPATFVNPALPSLSGTGESVESCNAEHPESAAGVREPLNAATSATLISAVDTLPEAPSVQSPDADGAPSQTTAAQTVSISRPEPSTMQQSAPAFQASVPLISAGTAIASIERLVAQLGLTDGFALEVGGNSPSTPATVLLAPEHVPDVTAPTNPQGSSVDQTFPAQAASMHPARVTVALSDVAPAQQPAMPQDGTPAPVPRTPSAASGSTVENTPLPSAELSAPTVSAPDQSRGDEQPRPAPTGNVGVSNKDGGARVQVGNSVPATSPQSTSEQASVIPVTVRPRTIIPATVNTASAPESPAQAQVETSTQTRPNQPGPLVLADTGETPASGTPNSQAATRAPAGPEAAGLTNASTAGPNATRTATAGNSALASPETAETPSPFVSSNAADNATSYPGSPVHSRVATSAQIVPDTAAPTTMQALPGSELAPLSPATSETTNPPVAATDGTESSEPVRFTIETPKPLTVPGRITVRLDPPELGTIRIDLSLSTNGVVGRMRLDTESVRTMVERDMPALHRALADAGVRVERFEITGSTAARETAGAWLPSDAGQQAMTDRAPYGRPSFESPHGSRNRNARDGNSADERRRPAAFSRSAGLYSLRVGQVNLLA